MDFYSIIVSGVLYDCFKACIEGGFKLTIDSIKNSPLFPEKIVSLDELNFKPLFDQINDCTSKTEKIECLNDTLNRAGVPKTNFARRLDYIIAQINNCRKPNDQINLDYLGEFLELSSVNELKKFYDNEEEPTYGFIEQVAHKLGVNPNWMKNGMVSAYPFRVNLVNVKSLA